MKKFIPLIIFFFSFSLLSQTEKEKTENIGFITGKIVDFKSKTPIPYANIICKDKTKVIVGGGITNDKGIFEIDEILLDSIFVDIQFIGFKTIKRTLILTKSQSKIDLKTIFLEEDIDELEEVVIQSETSTIVQKIDRKVINVGKDLASAGTNSLQMLENIPSVQVNFQNGSINLRGNENVRVLIDGKPSNLSPSQLLKQIPSSSVKSVELITNPSAKYNPEGMSGIINIILKKNTIIGFNGSFSIGAEHSINTRPTASLDLNYRTGKVNFYGNYSVDAGKFETFANFDRSDKDLSQTIDYLDNSTSHYIKTGLDFYIDKKNTLSFYTTQSFADTDFHIKTKTVENGNLILNTPNLSVFDIKEQAYNLDYKLDIDDKGQQIELEFNYSKSKNPQNDFNKETINPSSKIYNYTNTVINDNSIFLVNLDYSKPIKGGNLELGLEARTQKSFNNIITDQEVETGGNPATAPRGNSTFNYDREIYSAYINYNKEYKKIALQAGFRFEQFSVDGIFSNTQQTNLENYSDDIFSIYPSAFLTYYHSENNEFQLGYSRRVDRPGINQVTPIQEWTSPLTISVGNRTLTPQFTNSFEVNYTKTLTKGYLTLGTFYRSTNNSIGRIINKDDLNADRQILSYANYDTADSYGLEFSSSFKPTKWWTLRPSSSLYIQDSQGLINNKKESVKNTLFSARVSNSFKASKKLSFQLSSSYRGKSEGVQFKVDPYFLLNASARLSIFDGNGALSIRATDIFDNYKLAFSSTNPFPQTGNFSLEYSSIYLGFSYNFGSGKNRERDRKYREENETQGSGGVL
ncbi:TonB-dependent receptor [Polaribacter pectinis]|uniref:TonB-dependent receptor n=1 Tax=Polaribacter pectinis TaxID=2738844 RepID=A0A7G9LEF7_9FLAO|nr:outer membrane beta-barrel family protein [Polaribacter pectinis]QNM87006.1 TonB-dependent receptor [Polaribacter pectinis]